MDVDEDFQPLVNLLKDCIGSQVLKLESIPATLDEVVALLETDHPGTKEKPLVVKTIIMFELPDQWSKQVERELQRLRQKMTRESESSTDEPNRGAFWNVFLFVIVVAMLIYVFI